ncbi:ribonuclease HII [Alloscardovia theropitheci]|uniref:Ribonuclease n=1 Tax=Alloscardovia theropitheci TaxID=2496842 RepID=A0A4R0QWT9_9BIFI|nr:ribonuclease HII [Alloscardovia theropitheci]TCD53791.1 ribonuclease HII [Alloscardovia theropitheci]
MPTRKATSTSTIIPTWELESQIVDQGAQWIIGIDEVGRGCLAGPVTLGAAAFRADHIGSDTIPQGLKDSKLLTAKRRESLIDPVKQWADAINVGSSSNNEIDEWGISYCLGIAALRALYKIEHFLIENDREHFMPRTRVAVILDGPHDYISPVIGTFESPDIPIIPRVYTLVKGDQKCASVAAASVYAKVHRDTFMSHLAQENPQWLAYGWDKNKGYGSAQHRQAIKDFGTTEYHRVSWNLT